MTIILIIIILIIVIIIMIIIIIVIIIIIIIIISDQVTLVPLPFALSNSDIWHPLILRPRLRPGRHPLILCPRLRPGRQPLILCPRLRPGRHPLILRPRLRPGRRPSILVQGFVLESRFKASSWAWRGLPLTQLGRWWPTLGVDALTRREVWQTQCRES